MIDHFRSPKSCSNVDEVSPAVVCHGAGTFGLNYTARKIQRQPQGCFGRIKGVRYEWRFLKQVNKKGLPLPIKELSETFIGKEALICLTDLSSKS